MTDKEIIDKLKTDYPQIANAYQEIVKEQFLLFAKKMLDYGVDNIAMGTRLETPEEKTLSLTAIWIRCNDKMNRLKNLVLFNKKNQVDGEVSIDSYMDLVNYNIIAQIVHKDLWKR